METFEARIDRLEYSPADIFILEIVVRPLPNGAPGGGQAVRYTAELDPGAPSGPTMKPCGELQECFDVYHRFEYEDGLNPKLRRQWQTACLADQIVDSLFKSGTLRRLRINKNADTE